MTGITLSYNFSFIPKKSETNNNFVIPTAASQNGVTHSSTNIDEFVPEDKLDSAFLDEDKSGGRKRTSKPAAKKPPPKVEVEPDISEESDR